jgi:predicted MFS family arabinose efflux permease
LLVGYVSYKFGYRAIFVVAAFLAVPAALCLLGIDSKQIDYARARGAVSENSDAKAEGFSALVKDRVLLFFLAAAFLFHFANAAMLPQLGELLSKDNPKAAAPFMSACIIVTQLVITISAAWIGRRAAAEGRKPLLLLGYGVLPIRGALYTLTHAAGALIAIQVLDGVANAIFGIVSILVIKDRTQGTGRFNVAAGSLATMVGIGAAASTTFGGVLIQRLGYRASFLGLAGIALLALRCYGSPCLKLSPSPRPNRHLSSGAESQQKQKPSRSECAGQEREKSVDAIGRICACCAGAYCRCERCADADPAAQYSGSVLDQRRRSVVACSAAGAAPAGWPRGGQSG